MALAEVPAWATEPILRIEASSTHHVGREASETRNAADAFPWRQRLRRCARDLLPGQARDPVLARPALPAVRARPRHALSLSRPPCRAATLRRIPGAERLRVGARGEAISGPRPNKSLPGPWRARARPLRSGNAWPCRAPPHRRETRRPGGIRTLQRGPMLAYIMPYSKLHGRVGSGSRGSCPSRASLTRIPTDVRAGSERARRSRSTGPEECRPKSHNSNRS